MLRMEWRENDSAILFYLCLFRMVQDVVYDSIILETTSSVTYSDESFSLYITEFFSLFEKFINEKITALVLQNWKKLFFFTNVFHWTYLVEFYWPVWRLWAIIADLQYSSLWNIRNQKSKHLNHNKGVVIWVLYELSPGVFTRFSRFSRCVTAPVHSGRTDVAPKGSPSLPECQRRPRQQRILLGL